MSRVTVCTQPLRSLRFVPVAARAVYSANSARARSQPSPTPPTPPTRRATHPSPEETTTDLWIAGGLAVMAAGGSYYYYYYVDQAGPLDPHAQLKANEELLKQKAEEFREAGKATAHDAARDCQSKYEETKSSGQDKLAHARAEVGKAGEEARSTAVRQYEKVVGTAAGATHKVEERYDEAAKKAKEEAETWNQWLWSWFGYSQHKAEETKREAAAKVAEGARKVENEAGKRT
ncbi:hypothetical protein LXA43DRAFT_969848 [Ganoderma leucocontextum]|nr:hypothetical protein LXA43DRAFT_969848 [Ganoderma leucocontextum]